MYDIEAKIPYVPYAGQQAGKELRSEWEDVHNIPQFESDEREYQEAVKLAEVFREYYVLVRVVKINPGGLREVVRECPFTHSHTREWCGYSECRVS